MDAPAGAQAPGADLPCRGLSLESKQAAGAKQIEFHPSAKWRGVPAGVRRTGRVILLESS
jgi:hypothetical protein